VRVFCLTLCSLFLLGHHALAQEPVEDAAALAARLEAEDARLNASYKEAMAKCDERLRPFLRDAQRAWLKMRDAGADTEAARYSDADGGRQRARLKALADLTALRADGLGTIPGKTLVEETLGKVEEFTRQIDAFDEKDPPLLEWAYRLPEPAWHTFTGDLAASENALHGALLDAFRQFRKKEALFYALVHGRLQDYGGQFPVKQPPGLNFAPIETAKMVAEGSYSITEESSFDEYDGNKTTSIAFYLSFPGVTEKYFLGGRDESQYTTGGTSRDGYTRCRLFWLVPRKLLWASIEEELSGSGLCHEQEDRILEIQNDKLVQLASFHESIFGKSGIGYHGFSRQSCHWDQARQTLTLLNDSESNAMVNTSNALFVIGEFQSINTFKRRQFHLRDGKLQPGETIYALNLRDEKIAPADLANFLAVAWEKELPGPIEGTAPAEAVAEKLAQLKEHNPELAATDVWTGLVYLPGPLYKPQEGTQ